MSPWLAKEDFFSSLLEAWETGGQLKYYSNTGVQYAVRGVQVTLDILWNWEAPPDNGDVCEATFRGTRSRAEIRQGKEENFRPELHVRPNTAALRDEVFAALKRKIHALQEERLGVDMAAHGEQARTVIPEKYRVSHEDHFAQVTRAIFGYLKDPKSLPAWEKSNLLVKYYICTKGVELSRSR